MDRRRRPAPQRRNDDSADSDGRAGQAGGREWTDVAAMTLRVSFTATMLGLAVVHVAAAVADVVIIPEAPLLPLAPLATAAVLVLLGLDHLRRPRTGAALRTMLGLACAVTTADVGAHLVVGGDPMYTVYLTLALVAAGAWVPQVGWLLVCDLFAAVPVAVVALPRLAETHSQQAMAATTFAIAVAHLLQRHARRGRQQLQVLATALAQAALTDPLTRLANRQGLAEALERMLATAGPAASQGRPLAVLCFDVDGFKGINDDLGHAAGDAVLVEVACRLGELVRAGDVVARLGGDEFAVVLADIGPREASRVGERARLRLRGSAGVLDMPWSVSVGLACGSVCTESAVEDLMRRADLSMYEDKRARRSATARNHGVDATSEAGVSDRWLPQLDDVPRIHGYPA